MRHIPIQNPSALGSLLLLGLAFSCGDHHPAEDEPLADRPEAEETRKQDDGEPGGPDADETARSQADDPAAEAGSHGGLVLNGTDTLVRLDGPQATAEVVREELVSAAARYLSDAVDASRSGCPTASDGRSGTGRFTLFSSGLTPGPTSQNSPGSVSGTNNQVSGVDEADFIKTAGAYTYVLANGLLQIIQSWPADSTRVVARLPVDGVPRKLLLGQDRLTVYAAVPRHRSGAASGDAAKMAGGLPAEQCTYGYDCQVTGDGTDTQLSVFDISEPAQPRLTKTILLAGSLIAARRVGASVFTVVTSPGPGITLPGPHEFELLCKAQSDSEREAAYEQLLSQHTKRIAQTEVSEWLPTVTARLYAGGDRASLDRREVKTGFYRRVGQMGRDFVTLVAMNTADDTALPRASTVLSRPGTVYANARSIYLAIAGQSSSVDWPFPAWGTPFLGPRGWWTPWVPVAAQETTIYKLAIDAEQATFGLVAEGKVKGRVLNQFSLDEHRGYLRVATTSGRVPDPDVHSTMTVLQQQGDALVEVGVVNRLAPGEDIRSVRFDGARAFVVTFKKTDPLFVFDLGSPTSPKVVAELKIPGFSTYMQMMGEDHLLTIGYDADDQGSFALFSGVMLQIFDLRDLGAPRRIHREVIGTRGSSSEALTNHLAFNFHAPAGLLALPLTVCESGRYGNKLSFSGLLVYDVSLASGFSRRGGVRYPGAGSGVTCDNWWTRGSSQVKRSIMMDDYVLSLSNSLLKVNHLADLSRDVASVSLIAPEER